MVKYILHVIPGFGGGVASLVLNLAEEISKKDIIFDILTYEKPSELFLNRVQSYGGTVFVVDVQNRIGKLRAIDSILKNNKGKYQLLHMHQSGAQALSLSILAKINGISRTAIHSHITDKEGSEKIGFRIKMFFERIINNHCATHRLSCSKMASNYLYGEKETNDHKIMHIPNAILWDRICKKPINADISDFKNKYSIPDNVMLIGHVGYFGYQKNHKFMLDVIESMKKNGEKFIWLFAGEGVLKDEIELEVKKRNLGEYVRFLGRVNNVSLLYSIMDVMALPSFFEGLPTVAIEAQAAGVPSVISSLVTEEADMGLGLTEYVPLNVEKWSLAIKKMAKVSIPSSQVRYLEMSKRKFIVSESAQLYKMFIEKKILTYNLGEYNEVSRDN